MLIPRFWSRAESQATTPDGKRVEFHVWRGSRSSPAEAETLAREAVGRIAGRIQRGEGFPERYSYGDRPLREEVVREFPGATDEAPDAALTRNSYGALVLNAARVFFIDVDVPQSGASAPRASSPGGSLQADVVAKVVGMLPPALRSIAEMFLPSSPQPQPAAQPASTPSAATGATGPALDRLRRWVAEHPEWRVRVYRTHAGLRYLVTHALFSPADAEAQAAMTALGSDPQYIRLCRAQKSFRARLTPKPWRVGMEKPPVRFPYQGDDERRMREWEGRYARASEGYATCELLEEVGGGADHPEITPLLRLHDEHTRVGSGLPLA
jgi:hypothetical protein